MTLAMAFYEYIVDSLEVRRVNKKQSGESPPVDSGVGWMEDTERRHYVDLEVAMRMGINAMRWEESSPGVKDKMRDPSTLR